MVRTALLFSSPSCADCGDRDVLLVEGEKYSARLANTIDTARESGLLRGHASGGRRRRYGVERERERDCAVVGWNGAVGRRQYDEYGLCAELKCTERRDSLRYI